jgi:hypothetical protein
MNVWYLSLSLFTRNLYFIISRMYLFSRCCVKQMCHSCVPHRSHTRRNRMKICKAGVSNNAQEGTSCVQRLRNCFSCVLHVYRLRPEFVNPKHDESRPAVSKKLYQLLPIASASCVLVASRVVNRTHMICIERYGYTKCPTIGRFLHSFIVLYFIHSYM